MFLCGLLGFVYGLQGFVLDCNVCVGIVRFEDLFVICGCLYVDCKVFCGL